MSEDLSKCKRITINFERAAIYTPEQKREFEEWKSANLNSSTGYVYDKRNGIYCAAPTGDFDMYYNYLMYLNSCRNEWVNSGYFDAGLVPYIMLPDIAVSEKVVTQSSGIKLVRSSIDNIAIMLRKLAVEAGINIIQVPAVTFLKNSCVSSFGSDIWLFRDEMLKLCNILAENEPGCSLSGLTEDTVCLTKFIDYTRCKYNKMRQEMGK